MNRFNIFFENSPLWLFPAVLLAGFFAYLLYHKVAIFSGNVKKVLGAVRFLLLFILLLLLVTPVIKQILNYYEDPVLVLAIDNSTSILSSVDSVQLQEKIDQIKDNLEGEYQIQVRSLHEEVAEDETLTFNSLSTDLHGLLNDISNDYENRNLGAVVMFTDGIFNQGINPVYTQYSYPIYTVGLGDTTAYTDVGINRLKYNKLSYQGNKIPIQAEIAHAGLKNENLTISLIHDGEVIEEKNVAINRDKGLLSELFFVEANEQGIQRYEVVLNTSVEERNTTNNRKTAFIDIVEGKKNILLIAPHPHPDIKALKSAITENQNYEFIQYIPVLAENVQSIINLPVDLVIMHQLPQISMASDPVYRKFSADSYAKWWITGPSINYNLFNQANKTITVNQVIGQTDKVTAWFNPDFTAFNLSDDLKAIFNSLPPVSVPFSNYEINPAANIFLNQQVGTVQTSKPLFVTSNVNDIREGIFLGDGLWQWKLYEYAQHQTHKRFNELISKTVQFLSTREDKRKFRFYPIKNEFNEGEQVIFEAEVYNDLYEPVFGQQVRIEIKDQDGEIKNFQYVTSETNSRYAVSGLEPGVYQYSATTSFNNSTMEINGDFAVNSLDLENLRLTADHALLKELSNTTGGSFYNYEEIENLQDVLRDKDFKQRIQSTEDFLPLINIELIGILLLLLASSEWITRKYNGSY